MIQYPKVWKGNILNISSIHTKMITDDNNIDDIEVMVLKYFFSSNFTKYI